MVNLFTDRPSSKFQVVALRILSSSLYCFEKYLCSKIAVLNDWVYRSSRLSCKTQSLKKHLLKTT